MQSLEQINEDLEHVKAAQFNTLQERADKAFNELATVLTAAKQTLEAVTFILPEKKSGGKLEHNCSEVCSCEGPNTCQGGGVDKEFAKVLAAKLCDRGKLDVNPKLLAVRR